MKIWVVKSCVEAVEEDGRFIIRLPGSLPVREHDPARPVTETAT
jgi:hypothetical protein